MTQPTANFDAGAILNALISSAKASGRFESVSGHEPKNKPGNGVTAALMVGPLGPARSQSGLAATTVLWLVTLRIFINLKRGPLDRIEIDLANTAVGMMAVYSGDFDLGGLIRDVDLLGMYGTPLAMKPGYLEQDGTLYRIADVVIPMTINDVFGQVA